MKVLCITGWCRNGSTIIGNILNETPGVFHVGEIHFLWRNAVGKGANSSCGCGKALTECELWSEVLDEGRPAGMTLRAHADQVIARQRAWVRTRHTWRVLRRGLHTDGIRAHADLMTRTFQAVAERTGARVLVDTNKIPGEAALLAHLDGVTPYYVHLVRDPRAVAQSWSVEKDYCFIMPARTSTAYWHGFNTAAQAILRRFPERSMFLRYEDFIADPQPVIGTLLRLCEEDETANPVRGREVELQPNHTVTGNPDRFFSGSTLIRDRDDRWRSTLTVPSRLAAVSLAWPQFRRYGYSYRGTLAGRADGPGN